MNVIVGEKGTPDYEYCKTRICQLSLNIQHPLNNLPDCREDLICDEFIYSGWKVLISQKYRSVNGAFFIFEIYARLENQRSSNLLTAASNCVLVKTPAFRRTANFSISAATFALLAGRRCLVGVSH